MTSLKNRIALASFAILGLAHGALPVAAGDRTSIRVAPLKGISVTAGTKQAIGYYVAEKGACNLTLMLSEIFRASVLQNGLIMEKQSPVCGDKAEYA